MNQDLAVDRALAILREYFTNGQILVSWNEDGLTKAKYLGFGDWYSRQGMAHEFINDDQAQSLAKQINEKLD